MHLLQLFNLLQLQLMQVSHHGSLLGHSGAVSGCAASGSLRLDPSTGAPSGAIETPLDFALARSSGYFGRRRLDEGSGGVFKFGGRVCAM